MSDITIGAAPGQAPGGPDSNEGGATATPSTPSPLLFELLTATLPFGLTTFVLYRSEDVVTLLATVSDANPAAIWDLTGATVTFHLRSTSSKVGIYLDDTAYVVDASAKSVAYDFKAADIGDLVAGAYTGAFVIAFPAASGRTVTRQFGTIPIVVHNDPT